MKSNVYPSCLDTPYLKQKSQKVKNYVKILQCHSVALSDVPVVKELTCSRIHIFQIIIC